MSKFALKFLLWAMVISLHIIPQQAFAESGCDVTTLVSDGSSGNEGFSQEILDEFVSLGPRHPFVLFATDVRAHIVNVVANRYCDDLDDGESISINIVFWQFDFMASDRKFSQVKDQVSSLGDFQVRAVIDEKTNTYKFDIVWSARQIWRDLLYIHGLIGSSNMNALSFSQSEFMGALSTYSSGVAGASRMELGLRVKELLRGRLEEDLFLLFELMPIRGIDYYRMAVLAAYHDIELGGSLGYLAVTKQIIDGLIEGEESNRRDILASQEVRKLYCRDLERAYMIDRYFGLGCLAEF